MIVVTTFIQAFFHDLQVIISNKKLFLFKISINSNPNTEEFLKNLEEMFVLYHKNSAAYKGFHPYCHLQLGLHHIFQSSAFNPQ